MNRDDALNGATFHYGNCTRQTGPRGGVTTHTMECRRTGANKTWKTRPADFRVPIKHGLRGYGEITPENVDQFHTPQECPLLDNSDHSAGESHSARIQPVTYAILPGTYHRVVCTCGFVTEPVRFRFNAEAQMAEHLNTNDPAVMAAGLLSQDGLIEAAKNSQELEAD